MKKKNMQYQSKPQCTFFSNMQQVTIQSILDPVCIRGSKPSISFQNSYWGKFGLFSEFYLFIFSIKKKDN